MWLRQRSPKAVAVEGRVREQMSEKGGLGMDHSKFVHFEIPADNVERARKFYEALFGWNIRDMSEAGFSDYWSVMVSDDENDLHGGMMERQEGITAPHFYISVESVDRTLERRQELGGTVVMPKDAVPRMGWLALFKDPEGNVFGLWQDDPTSG